MICISVKARNMAGLLSDFSRAQELAGIVEVRADGVNGFNLEQLLRHKRRPIIFALRSNPLRDNLAVHRLLDRRELQPRIPGSPRGSPTRVDHNSLCSNCQSIIPPLKRGQTASKQPLTSRQTVLVRQALASAKVDYVDVDVRDMPRLMPLAVKHQRKIIVSYHNFSRTPANLDAVYRRLVRSYPVAAGIKIVSYAHRLADNLRIFRLARYAKQRRLTAFCMGEAGAISRILYRKFGFWLTYACLEQGKETAPGQIPFAELKSRYGADRLTKRTQIYGLLGYPLGHSQSPQYFNTLFRCHQLNKVYLPLPMRQLQGGFRALVQGLNIHGLSVTIPHKTSVIKYLDKLTPEAMAIGAVNTVYRRGGRLIGANTDWQGAAQAINIPAYLRFRRRTHPGGKPAGSPAKRGNDQAVILGGGGVARAIAWALLQHQVPVTIVTRNPRQGKKIAADLGRPSPVPSFALRATEWVVNRVFRSPARRDVGYQSSGFGAADGCRYAPWKKLYHLRNISLLVNATPIGMFPDIESSPVRPSIFSKSMWVFDTVYNPVWTRFLKDAVRRGCKTISGVKMFRHQAKLQSEYFIRPHSKYE